MATKTISQMAACSHYHFFNPFCPRQTSSQKVANVFFYALGAAVIWISYQALRPRTNSVTPQVGRQDAPLTGSPHLKAALTLYPLNTAPPIKPSESKMATFISRELDILGLPLSLDVIQKRAEPKDKDNSGGETARGFVHKGDSVYDSITKAWKIARAANVTHIEIADHLSEIIKIARTKQSGAVFHYDWDTKQAVEDEKKPRLQVVFYTVQKDDVIETDIFRPEDADKKQGESNEEMLIRNPAVIGKCIRWTSVREDYIRKYGFYSSGTEIDELLAILARPLSR